MDVKFCLDLYHFPWILHIFCLFTQIIITESSNCPTLFWQTDRVDQQTDISKNDLQECDLFYDLVTILEKLNILIPRNTSCYSLKKVFQSYDVVDPKSNFQMINITFQFQENFKSKVDKTPIDTTATNMCNDRPGLYNAPFQGRQFGNAGKTLNESESTNKSVVAAKSSADDDDSSVLSHTQVVVIATCSAVIGTFFILAAALRIRNYVKRLREEQQSSRRSNNFRLPLSKGPNSLDGLSRKSSNSSRKSQQNSLLDRDGKDIHINSNSPSACHQPLLKTMPSLIVTAPSSAASTPGDSHSSIQFIDEDLGNNVVNAEEQNDMVFKDNEQDAIPEKTSTEDTNVELTGNNPIPEIIEDPVEIVQNQVQNNTELHNGNCHDDNEINAKFGHSLKEMHAVTIGLTQSDDSMSSHNASYCYGNQVEYAAGSAYGNFGYCPPCETVNEVENYEMTNDVSDHNSPMTNKNKYNLCENGIPSFERDEIKGLINDNSSSDKKCDERPSLQDMHNVVSLDQYEQRRRLQRQDRTLTQTSSFDGDV